MNRPPRRAQTAPARAIALDVLLAVELDDAYANLALAGELGRRRPDRREAALATELVFGTLRLRGRYDAVLTVASSRPLAETDPVTRNALRLGCHQLLTMATADYAAVSATVDQVTARRGVGAGRFANAVLRRVAQRPWAQWRDEIVVGDDPVARAAVEWSHPEWVVRALTAALADSGAAGERDDLLRRNDEPAPVTLVARPGRGEPGALLAATQGSPGLWSPWAVRVTGDPGRFAQVRSGAAGVQDEGSQLMALAVTRLDTPAGDWLDLCSGPGGKTADLAGPAADAGARLVAVEQHPHRAELVRRATAGGAPVEVVTGDATSLPLAPAARILLDAPCTGLGAVRRRPELRWRRQPGDLPALRRTQAALLDRAVDLLVPGGCVAYVTCSPHLGETSDVVAGVLARRSDVAVVPAAGLLPEIPDAGDAAPYVRLWPHRHDTDGMFLAVLRKI